jgi:phenylalanine-4-hydroxylase
MDLSTIMRTGYEIDSFQKAYFVLPSFEALRKAMEEADIPALIARHKNDPPLDPTKL